MDSPRVLVVQNGARHNYAVPTVLAQAGMLEAFYTDACGNVGAGQWLSAGRFLPFFGSYLNRLYHRQIPAEVRPRTVAFFSSTLRNAVAPRLTGMRRNGEYTAQQMVRRGLGAANLVY